MHTSVEKRESYDSSPYKEWVNTYIKDVDWYQSRAKEIQLSEKTLSVDDICLNVYNELAEKITNYFATTPVDQDIIQTELLRAKTLCCVLRRWRVAEIVNDQ